jgi:small subunit ribosomal protein S16
MALKLRLQRHGRKKRPYYHIVAADARAPRDGRIVERIGSYNPNTNPATIDLNFDKALTWIQKGAQPTDTVRAILSYRGVMHMNHLLKGVNKGAHTEEQAKAKFQKWIEEQAGKIDSVKTSIADANAAAAAAALERESKVRETRAAEIEAKNNPIVEEVEAAIEETSETEDAPEATAEVEAPVAEEAVAEEVVEAPAETEEAPEATAEVEAPVVEEVAAEEVAEAPAVEEEVVADAPAETEEVVAETETEEVVEETPAAEVAPVAKAEETTEESTEDSSKEA